MNFYCDASFHRDKRQASIGIVPIYSTHQIHCETAYEAETMAIYISLLYCPKKTVIHSDCLVAVKAISKKKKKCTAFQEKIRTVLKRRKCKLKWVPRHTPGIKAADKLARSDMKVNIEGAGYAFDTDEEKIIEWSDSYEVVPKSANIAKCTICEMTLQSRFWNEIMGCVCGDLLIRGGNKHKKAEGYPYYLEDMLKDAKH